VRDLIFRVEGSEVYGLLGPNCSGKARRLKIILGLAIADRGRTKTSLDGDSRWWKVPQAVDSCRKILISINFLTAKRRSVFGLATFAG